MSVPHRARQRQVVLGQVGPELPWIHCNETESGDSNRSLSTRVRGCGVHNSQSTAATRVSVNGHVDKQEVAPQAMLY